MKVEIPFGKELYTVDCETVFEDMVCPVCDGTSKFTKRGLPFDCTFCYEGTYRLIRGMRWSVTDEVVRVEAARVFYNGDIDYELTNGYSANSKECFLTREEAQAEADRRNKEESP